MTTFIAPIRTIIGYIGDRPVYQIAGGATDPGDGGGEPANDAPSYTPPATQAELDRIIQARLSRHKPDDYDDLQAKAQRLADLEAATATDTQKAIAEAKREAQAAAVPQIVRAEFKAAAKGVLTADQVNELLEDLDLSKYVDSKGKVDESKIERKVNAFAPPKQDPPPLRPGFGQGKQPAVRLSAKEQGAAEAAKRFGSKTA